MKKFLSSIMLASLTLINGCATPNTLLSSMNQSSQYMFESNIQNTEEYKKIEENSFLNTINNPLSTFSIDVDTASYSNIRRLISSGNLPPKDSVRLEEMINYFSYDYPQPEANDPFSINLEIANAPWKKDNKLVSIGIQGRKIDKENLPPSNLVFLIDTSGSMTRSIQMLKESFKLLVSQLSSEDKVSIVTYAGSAGLVLDSTSDKEKIIDALDKLQAGGSTAGGEGIKLAYKVAKDNFIKNGNNRVILATDGDFNVGISSESELINLIEEKRKEGSFLSVLGFGSGNYKDSKMEQLADKGNGNYAYIDSLREAKKVLVEQMTGTILSIAKDVKIQIEFNPTKVKSYRLIGYENRVLKNQDFNDDKKDAGDLGAGHSVTALYELTLADKDNKISDEEKLKYQEIVTKPEAFNTNEILNLKLRYKEPKQEESKLLSKNLEETNVDISQASNNLKFASTVASFGMLLRDSEYKGDINIDKIIEMAKESKGKDTEGYRNDFINLINQYKSIKNK